MLRGALILSASAAALLSVSGSAKPPEQMGMPVAPNGGKASIHQWGGVDDAFAVNPDGYVVPRSRHVEPMQRSQEDSEDDGDDPDADHSGEVLPI